MRRGILITSSQNDCYIFFRVNIWLW